MKKIISLFAGVCALLMCASLTALADDGDIGIIVDGVKIETDSAPVMINDRVLVPMRSIFEALGATVEWDGTEYAAKAVKDGNAVSVPINLALIRTGIVNSDNQMLFSSEISIDVPAQIINDRTMVPVRAVSEALKAEVSWDGEAQTVLVTSPTEGDNKIFYSSSDDYGKVFSVDTNGAKRTKLSDISAKQVYYKDGIVYYVSNDDMIYSCNEDGSNQKQLTYTESEFIGARNGSVYVLNKSGTHRGALYEITDGAATFLGDVKNPVLHNDYIYYNENGVEPMIALNLDTHTATWVEMGADITLTPYNCVFYGDYILVEDGSSYNNILRFNADGTDMIKITNGAAQICRNQEEDARILYINNEVGQDIYYSWIDGSYDGIAIDMPDDCVYADVVAQKGDYIFYKNMYREEIYRTDFDGTENTYVAYGDSMIVDDDVMFVENEGLYRANLDGSDALKIYSRKLIDYFSYNKTIFGKDNGFGNIIRIDYDGNNLSLTNDKVISWTSTMEQQ